MDEEALKRKLAAIIEALPGGTSTAQEQHGSETPSEHLANHVKAASSAQQVVEFHFTLVDEWQQRLFWALARRYGLKPFRDEGQRETTFMLRAPERFVEETFWPKYQQLTVSLRDWLGQVTERVIRDVLQVEMDHEKVHSATPSQDSNAAGPAA